MCPHIKSLSKFNWKHIFSKPKPSSLSKVKCLAYWKSHYNIINFKQNACFMYSSYSYKRYPVKKYITLTIMLYKSIIIQPYYFLNGYQICFNLSNCYIFPLSYKIHGCCSFVYHRVKWIKLFMFFIWFFFFILFNVFDQTGWSITAMVFNVNGL